MIVEFELDDSQTVALQSMMVREHAGYYAQPHGWLVAAGYRSTKEWDEDFAWLSSAGNTLAVHRFGWGEDVAVYTGRRGGLVDGGFLQLTVPVLEPSVQSGRWRYRETTTPDWGPFDIKGRPYVHKEFGRAFWNYPYANC